MDRERLHNQVIREIIARVASGAYRDGQRLPAERALCREFDVARGTLRRALSKLDELKVVRIKAGSGVYVQSAAPHALPPAFLPPGFPRVHLQDVIDARKAIELAAVEQAAQRVRGADLRRLAGLLAAMEACVDDLPRFLQLDVAFHQAIVRASGNAVLVTAFEAIAAYHRFSAVYTSQREGEEEEALAYHRRLLEALERKDAAGCRRILQRHLDTMSRYSRGANGRRPSRRTGGGRNRP